MRGHWSGSSVPKARCAILWWHFLCFAQSYVYTVCASPTVFWSLGTEESKTRGHTRKMIHYVVMF